MTDVQKNTRTGSSGDAKDSNIDSLIRKELDEIFKKNRSGLTVAQLSELRKKYSRKDEADIADKIIDEFTKQQKIIKRAAQKFYKFISKKYGSGSYTASDILKKSMKIKQKHNWSDAFYREFKRLVEVYISGNIPQTYRPSKSLIAKTLGMNLPDVQEEPQMNVSGPDAQYVEKMIQAYKKTKSQWANLSYQTFLYRSVSAEVVNGKFDPNKDDCLSHVHPVIALLFGRKISYFEERFLYANLPGIIKARSEGKPIATRPDAEFVNALITDPQDVLCSANSQIQDLYQRSLILAEVWAQAYNFRNGKFYGKNSKNFLAELNECRLSSYDMPDLTFVADVGAVFRQLISVAAIRPTIIMTAPVQSTGLSPMPYDRVAVPPRLRKVPFVTLRLPPNQPGMEAVSLEDSMRQAQWFLEGKHLVFKGVSVAQSDSVLNFYVNRLNSVEHLSSVSTNMMNMPLTIGGIEDLNETPINFNRLVRIDSDVFTLCSVLASEKIDIDEGKRSMVPGVAGSITLLVKEGTDGGDDTFFRYDPVAAGFFGQDPRDGSQRRPSPVSLISEFPTAEEGMPESFTEIASTRGIIFVYDKVSM